MYSNIGGSKFLLLLTDAHECNAKFLLTNTRLSTFVLLLTDAHESNAKSFTHKHTAVHICVAVDRRTQM